MDTSAGENETPKKNFNIHISEDNQEQIELDDEEEEEEEDEQVVKTDLKENKEDNDKNTIDIKEENNNSNIENSNNLNNEPNNNEINGEEKKKEENNMINNIEKKSEKNNSSKEEEKIEAKNIIINNESNNNDIHIIKKEDSQIKEKDNKIIEEIKNTKEENIGEDINEVCHLYLKKGNDFNSKEIYCIPITQIKNGKRKSILQKMNVFKKPKNEVINYKIFMEENYIYLAKDIIIDKKNDALRRIYKIYNVRNILNYTCNKELNSNKYKIIFEIMNKKLINKSKEYFIDEENFKEFDEAIRKRLQKYGDKLTKI